MTGQKLGSQPYTFTMNSGSEYQWGCKKHVLGEMSLLLKSWESHVLAKLCLRAGMESVGHWSLHKDVTLTSSLDGEAMGCRHTDRAILQRFLCSSFSSLMSGDLSCCGVRRGRVMQAASSWRHLTEDPVSGNRHSWRLSVCAGMEKVHFSARNLQKWRQFRFLKGTGLSPAEGRTRIEVILSRDRDVCVPVCM